LPFVIAFLFLFVAFVLSLTAGVLSHFAVGLSQCPHWCIWSYDYGA